MTSKVVLFLAEREESEGIFARFLLINYGFRKVEWTNLCFQNVFD
jgi:hypothetical protein